MMNFVKTNESAERIAKMYVEKFPLKNLYAIDLGSTEDDTIGTHCFELKEDELEVLKQWKGLSDAEREEYVALEHFLIEKGRGDMVVRFLDIRSSYSLDLVMDCDLDEARHFVQFVVRDEDKEGEKWRDRTVSVKMTEEDFVQLLALHLTDKCFNFNTLIMRDAELASKIIEGINYSFCEGFCDYPNPYIVLMPCFVEAARKCMDPHSDILKAFESEDAEIRQFMLSNSFAPRYTTLFETYEKKDDEESNVFHVTVGFDGKKLVVSQEGVRNHGTWYDVKEVKFDAEKMCKSLNFGGYDELMEYVEQNFSVRDAIKQLTDRFGMFEVR